MNEEKQLNPFSVHIELSLTLDYSCIINFFLVFGRSTFTEFERFFMDRVCQSATVDCNLVYGTTWLYLCSNLFLINMSSI